VFAATGFNLQKEEAFGQFVKNHRLKTISLNQTSHVLLTRLFLK
jgi:hypothetical protein